MKSRSFPSVEFFDEVSLYGTGESPEESQKYWNNRAPSYKKHQDEGDNDSVHREILKVIAERTGLNKTHRVLDIGCGPGRHSRLLGQTAGWVAAFDLSPAMIDLAQKSPQPQGARISYSCLDFEQADLDDLGFRDNFYLALASRTPAVHDLKTLQKMNGTIGSGFGAIISSIETKNSLREPFFTDLKFSDQIARSARSVYLQFNMLWLLGYFPELTYFDQKWLAARPVEGAIASQVRYFEKIRPLTEAEKTAIAQTLRTRARDGLVPEEVEAKTVLMLWEKPPQNRAGHTVTDKICQTS
ncbi:MAG: class I SAM-dependent methyltransferase [Deltaproteobacteria bacterium]|jgi:SAM-dependent methyltransferase|nr:class I SAM-dependent methyltransferase [Deltaproteobacteria bacterium]